MIKCFSFVIIKEFHSVNYNNPGVCVCVRACMCVCVRVCAHTRTQTHTNTLFTLTKCYLTGTATAFDQLNSGCSSQHLLHLHFPTVVADYAVEVFPELVMCTAINSDQAVGKMPLTFLDTSERSTTHKAVCESHHHISQHTHTKKGDDRSGK